MIIPKDAPSYAVMNTDNDLVWTSHHYAFYKTLKHAREKVNRHGQRKCRIVKVTYEELCK